MKKSIYNVYVAMQDQEQCDRMKQLCIDNRLPYWKGGSGLSYDVLYGNQFYYGKISTGDCFVVIYNSEHTTQVTEQKFIELLKQHKMNPDDYIEGTFYSRNPANINEIEAEIDEEETSLEMAERQVKSLKQILDYKIWQLTRLSEIEQSFTTFGHLSHEEQKEKNEIFNQYTKQ